MQRLQRANHEKQLVELQLLTEDDCQAVQGSTYIRNTEGCSPAAWLARYLDAEFFVTHFVYFPAMEFVTSMGVFGGSNAL